MSSLIWSNFICLHYVIVSRQLPINDAHKQWCKAVSMGVLYAWYRAREQCNNIIENWAKHMIFCIVRLKYLPQLGYQVAQREQCILFHGCSQWWTTDVRPMFCLYIMHGIHSQDCNNIEQDRLGTWVSFLMIEPVVKASMWNLGWHDRSIYT